MFPLPSEEENEKERLWWEGGRQRKRREKSQPIAAARGRGPSDSSENLDRWRRKGTDIPLRNGEKAGGQAGTGQGQKDSDIPLFLEEDWDWGHLCV